MSYLPGQPPLINELLRAGIFDLSPFSALGRLTWLGPFAKLHTLLLKFMQSRLVVWIWRLLLSFHKPYTYEPLTAGEIRILRLFPGNACSILRCTLHRLNVDELVPKNPDDRRRYHALSYTWGAPKPMFPILCDGQVLGVTRNLFEALFYMRHRKIEEIWIDAVCIDQGNIRERNEQIQHMTKIYQNTRVEIWLGPGSKATDAAFDILDRINENVPLIPKPDEKLLLGLADEAEPLLSELLSRPWFRRVWIIQEAMVANSAMVYCGKRAHLWKRFEYTIGSLFLTGCFFLLLSPRSSMPIKAAGQLRLLTTTRPKEYSLLELASESRSAEATDARDKVYALLNLAKDSELLQSIRPHHAPPLLVDYTQPLWRVYTDVAKAMIFSNGLQDVLAEARHRDLSSHDIPTWVPDWRVQKRGNSIDQKVTTERSFLLQRRIRRPFCASQANGPFPRFYESDRLILQGIRVDVITQQSGVFPTMSGDGDLCEITSWLRECEGLAESIGSSSLHLTEDSFWRTLVTDTADGCRPAPNEFKEHYQQLRQFFENCKELPAEELYDMFNGQARKFSENMALTCQGRRLAVTGKQRIGLVPDTAEVGDVVVIFDGFTVPFVLRPEHKARFRLVGDCYMHGAMYGEAAVETIRTLRKRIFACRSEELTLV